MTSGFMQLLTISNNATEIYHRDELQINFRIQPIKKKKKKRMPFTFNYKTINTSKAGLVQSGSTKGLWIGHKPFTIECPI